MISANKQIEVKGFAEAFYSAPKNRRKIIRQKIQKVTGWSDPNFNSKRNGNRKLWPCERFVLNLIFEEEGIKFN